jgi:hypothetical protein
MGGFLVGIGSAEDQFGEERAVHWRRTTASHETALQLLDSSESDRVPLFKRAVLNNTAVSEEQGTGALSMVRIKMLNQRSGDRKTAVLSAVLVLHHRRMLNVGQDGSLFRSPIAQGLLLLCNAVG